MTNFRRVRKIAKGDYELRHACPAVCLSHGTTRISLEGFSLNLVFEYFAKICGEDSSLIKI